MKHMQHSDKHTCNIRLKKQVKHWEQTFATYVYNHCNICNIQIYFCNIHTKHLQHISETSETIKTYACNMRFQRNISSLLGGMEARRRVVFIGVEKRNLASIVPVKRNTSDSTPTVTARSTAFASPETKACERSHRIPMPTPTGS